MFQQKWAFLPVSGTLMKRVNLDFFYQFGIQLHHLATIDIHDNINTTEIYLWACSVASYTENVIGEYSALQVSRKAGEQLLESINIIKKIKKTTQQTWLKSDTSTDINFIQVVNKAKAFEKVLEEELSFLTVYYLSQKLVYSTIDLIEHAEATMPQPTLNKINEDTISEIRESGKCLVFDIPTAAGFHILRAMEIILHQYYVTICKPKTETRLNNWGAYIDALYKLAQDINIDREIREHVKKVLALLQQIKDQDRNLIMHPEMTLNTYDALVLFDTAKIAIIKMAERLPDLS